MEPTDARPVYQESKSPALPANEPERLRSGSLGMVDIAAATMAHRAGDELLLRVRVPGRDRRRGLAPDDHRRRDRDRPAGQHARPVLPGPALGRWLHHLRGQDVRPDERGHHRPAGRAGLHHRHVSVIAVSGGFLAITLKHYLGLDVPWIVWALLLTAISVVMMIRGVAVSTKLAGLFFGFEMLVLVVVSLWAIISHHGSLSLAPFQPSHITGGFRRPGRRVPAGDLPVHRLGELRCLGGGDRQTPGETWAGRSSPRWPSCR